MNRTVRNFAVFTLILSACLQAQAAILVTTEFAAGTGGYPSNPDSGFTTIANISNTDAAEGITLERDFGGGNFDASIGTNGLWDATTLDTKGFVINPSNRSTPYRYKIDLGQSVNIAAINTYSYKANNDPDRLVQSFSLYGSTTDTASFDETDGTTWTLIASVNTFGDVASVVSNQYFHGSSVSNINTSYREILWVNAAPLNTEATVFKEFDVVAVPEPSSIALMGIALISLLALRRRAV